MEQGNGVMVVEMTEYDPEGTAIIWQKPVEKEGGGN